MTTVNSTSRPDWDDYFMGVVAVVADRSTCDRASVGCVLVVDRRIVATGYVGAPPGAGHCDEVGHDLVVATDDLGRTHEHCVRTTHAEANAIAQAARGGVSVDGSTAYVSMEPCISCAQLLVAAGVRRVVALDEYHAAERARALFRDARVDVTVAGRRVGGDS